VFISNGVKCCKLEVLIARELPLRVVYPSCTHRRACSERRCSPGRAGCGGPGDVS